MIRFHYAELQVNKTARKIWLKTVGQSLRLYNNNYFLFALVAIGLDGKLECGDAVAACGTEARIQCLQVGVAEF